MTEELKNITLPITGFVQAEVWIRENLDHPKVMQVNNLLLSFNSALKEMDKKANGEVSRDVFMPMYETLLSDINTLLIPPTKPSKNEQLLPTIQEARQLINSMMLSMGAHPDCENGSEFHDYVLLGKEFLEKTKQPSRPSVFEKFELYKGDLKVSLEITQEKKDLLFEKVVKYCKDFGATTGETVHQMDDANLAATILVGDLVDDVLRFETEWVED